MERLFHAKRREIGIGCLDFGSMFNSFQLQHDATAAVFSLASSPSGVDMLDCKLNGSENRRMEIEQNIPKQKKTKTVLFRFIHYILLPYFDEWDEPSQRPHCILGGLAVHVCSVAMTKASKDGSELLSGEWMISTYPPVNEHNY